MQIADVAHLHAPHIGAEHRAARLEVGERVGGAALRQAQAAARGGDQHRADARRPALLREQVQQRLRLVEVAGLHGDVGQDGRREREARREIALLENAQRDARRGVRLGERSEPQLEEAEGAVGGDEPARAAGAPDLLEHRAEGDLNGARSARR